MTAAHLLVFIVVALLAGAPLGAFAMYYATQRLRREDEEAFLNAQANVATQYEDCITGLEAELDRQMRIADAQRERGDRGAAIARATVTSDGRCVSCKFMVRGGYAGHARDCPLREAEASWRDAERPLAGARASEVITDAMVEGNQRIWDTTEYQRLMAENKVMVAALRKIVERILSGYPDAHGSIRIPQEAAEAATVALGAHENLAALGRAQKALDVGGPRVVKTVPEGDDRG